LGNEAVGLPPPLIPSPAGQALLQCGLQGKGPDSDNEDDSNPISGLQGKSPGSNDEDDSSPISGLQEKEGAGLRNIWAIVYRADKPYGFFGYYHTKLEVENQDEVEDVQEKSSTVYSYG
jgi:hypothetical protein